MNGVRRVAVAVAVPLLLLGVPACGSDPVRGGTRLSRIEPLGQGTRDTARALVDGEVELAQVGTTDGTLGRLGVVVLRDDRNWQNAENVVPLANTVWLEDNPKARTELNKLSAVLTTEDLKALNARVADEHLEASRVAEDYLKEKGLL